MMLNNEIALGKTRVGDEETRVDVAVKGEVAVIRMLSYAEGIGWFVQKTMTIDADMLAALVDQLTAASGKMVSESDDILSAETLEF